MKEKVIVVIGLGPVGRNVAELLLRSGIKNIIVIEEGIVESDEIQQCVLHHINAKCY